MSGGFLGEQRERGHQVVIFTFAGELRPELIDKWNKAILDLKKQFAGKITGVTLKGEPTPLRLARRARMKAKRRK